MANVPRGIICSSQDYQLSRRNQSISCLTRGDAIGLTVTVEAGLLSLLAILCVFLMIGRNVVWRVQHMPTARLRIFHQPMDILIFSLLVADIIQAIGMVANIKWIRDGKVEVGTYCTAQGFIKIFGATGVALSSLAIAVYTFIGVWMMKGISSMRITTFVAIGIWVFISLLAVVGLATNNDPSKPSLIGPVPYWCWVNSHYLGWRLLGEYLWMWITLFLSLLIYVLLYLWMRGNIALEGHTWRFSASSQQYPHTRARRRRSLVMLVYPIVYCITIIPLSIARWMTFVHQSRNNGASHSMPAAATLACSAIFGLSGLLNVILLVTTKPESGLFGQLMFVSPAPPPLIISDQACRDTDAEYGLGKLSSNADIMITQTITVNK